MPVPPPPHTGQSETVPKLSRRDATVPFSHSSIQPAEPEKPLGARISELLNDDGKSHLLRGEQLAGYLAENHSNAFSLVAAFEATLDPEFLRQAAARFPDDPLVQ